MSQFKVIFLSPGEIVFDGEAWQVSATNIEGRFSIRAKHQNFFTTLKPGIVEIAADPQNRTRWKISSGILEFSDNTCNIICDSFSKE